MDYPKSVEGVGLVNGKFADENPATGQIGSLITSSWANAITEEILAVQKEFGQTPKENQNDQLLKVFACLLRFDKVQSLTPEQKKQALSNLGAASALSGNPVGSIIWFLGTDVPEGYLLCNGAAVSRTTYASLFKVVGTKCGAGDGASTFNLPNFNGRVPQGTTDTGQVGKTLEPQLPNISGGLELSRDDSIGATSSPRCFSVYRGSSSQNGFALASSVSGGSKVDFDAGLSNSVYTGSKLQVSALQLLACIRC